MRPFHWVKRPFRNRWVKRVVAGIAAILFLCAVYIVGDRQLTRSAGNRELEERTKDSLHLPALVNQYTSFIGNIMASRISAAWDFRGPAFTVSGAIKASA